MRVGQRLFQIALESLSGSVVSRGRGAALTFDLVKPALRAPGQNILIILIAKHAARPSFETRCGKATETVAVCCASRK